MSFSLSIEQNFGETNFTAEIVLSIENASDNDLVKSVLAGDESAFVVIFEKHKRAVAILAGRFFSRPEQTEEIIQISFANAYLSLKNFRGQHDKSFVSWLLQITNNACLDALRRQKRQREDLLCELTDEEDKFLNELMADKNNLDAETEIITKDLAQKLMSRLEPEEQMVLRLLHAAEMSAPEISALTGWSQSKIKVKAHRARKTLRKVLHKFL